MNVTTIGAHVSTAGGIPTALDRARAIGAACLQIFITSPRAWRKTVITDEQTEIFKAGVQAHGLSPVFIHALYLTNLATDDAALREKTIDALAHALTTADRIGAQGVVYHTGSRKERDAGEALSHVIEGMKEILDRAPGGSQLVVETAAGEQGKVGATFAEIGELVRRVNASRVKVCLDTCHVFAAGHDIRTPAGVKAMLADFDREIGLEHLAVVHANDSKFPLGSRRDRHENIGEGEIGPAGFQALLAQPELRSLPWFLEVPGFDGNGPDKKNIDILNSLAD